MKYRNSDDNRYRARFMVSTEKLMDQLTVKKFISYLEENAEFEDYTVEHIDGRCVNCKAYDLKEENSNLHKEFLVTEDGRVFYWRSLKCKVELVDRENKGGKRHDESKEIAYNSGAMGKLVVPGGKKLQRKMRKKTYREELRKNEKKF